MPEPWVPVTLAAAAFAAVGVYVLTPRRRRPRPVEFADPREERLTRRLAGAVGCTLAQALPAVRREIDISPNQTDEVLLKRATYHYRQEMPDAPCRVYPDAAPG